MDGRRQTLLVSLLGGVLFLCAPAAPAAAEEASQPPDTVSDQQTFDPGLTQDIPETAPVEEPTDEPIDTEEAETSSDDELSNETVQQPGWGSAADQSTRTAELDRR
jgi:hypothetical protein